MDAAGAAPREDDRADAPAAWTGPAARVLAAALAGLLVGFAARSYDRTTDAAGIGADIGLWTVLVTLVAAFAPSVATAAARAAAFMVAAMAAYYAAQAAQFGFLSRNVFIAWVALSITAVPAFAALAAQARRPGWLAAPAIGLPVGVLAAEAWTERHHLELHAASLTFNLVAALVLVVLLPASWRQRLGALACALPVAIVAASTMDLVLRVVPGS